MELPVKLKVMAYITHRNRLLVFRQPDFPEAGIQVPGGSVAAGEPLEVAVRREAFEETGLESLVLSSYLGDERYDRTPRGQAEIHHRHFYHFHADGDVDDTWEHWERDPSEGEIEQIRFLFSWVTLPNEVPPLIAGMDAKIPELLARMGLV